MAITFNSAERKSISLEIIDLPAVVQSANDTKTELQGQETELLAKDSDIKKFYDFYDDIVNAYQTERRWSDGNTYTQVTNAQIQAAAKNDDGNLYFPTTDTFSWVNYQPYIDPAGSNLKGEPITSSSNHEQEVTSNVDTDKGLTFLIDLLKNGQTGSTPMMVTVSFDGVDTLTVGMPPYSLSVGTYVLVGSVLLLVTAVVVVDTEYTVTPILGSGAASGTPTTSLPAYNNTQRNTLSGPQPAYLTLLTDAIKDRVDDWETSLTSQISALNGNEDDRSPQVSEITTALSDANNALSIVNAWQALPDTGSTGFDSKFTDNNLLTLENEITARASFASSRASEINTALGTLSQASDGTVSGSGAFRLRYDQLNNRINRIGGPLSEYYEKGEAVRALDQLATTKTSTLGEFENRMKATAFAANADGTNVITVVDTTDFSAGQTVYVVSETQSELTGTISSIDSATQMTLSFSVPSTYVLQDRARILRIV